MSFLKCICFHFFIVLMPSTIENVKRRYKLNKNSALILILALIASIVTLLLMNTMANISSFWSVDKTQPPLPDYAFEIFAEIELTFLVDNLMNIFITITMICILLRRNAIEIYFRFFVCMIVTYFIRMSIVSLSNLPTPNKECIKIVKNMFTTFTYDRCGDLMFSGHSLAVMVCALIWSSYYLLLNKTLSRLGCVSAWAVSFTIFLFILITRNHYTIDVLVSIYITTAVWVIYGFMWDKYLSEENVFKNLVIDN